jgi:hypothetical protein
VRTYQVVLVFHVVGAAGLVLGACFELGGLTLLRRARSVSDVRQAMAVASIALMIDPASSLLVFGTGVFLTATAWTWTTPWITTALIFFVLITLLAPSLQGRRLLAIRRMVRQTPDGPIPHALHMLIRDPILRASVQSVLPLTLGFLLLMTLKPALLGSLSIMIVALVAGILSGIPTRRSLAK